jgi:hypothetical protein
MISDGRAIVAETKWTVDGSEAKGRTMTNRATRMTLRAFNNECEVIIAKASWKNFNQMAERIGKLQSTLDKLNESNRLRIADAFAQLKLEELRLTHEERLKRHEEQEKLREEREKEREEAKAKRELEAEVHRAEAKEAQRREALMEARAELRAAGEAEKARLAAKITELEATLSAAQAATERAMSMAQQTKVGYVYVISNLGAFGEDVFKIGMTRRLEPLDRVRELGDASVPFPFDVHALIFTEDAPALERAIQVELDAHRVNRVNPRKEFFRVPPEELKAKVKARFANVVYLDRPEAEEYLQSLPKAAIESMAATERQEAFPASI